MYHNKKLIVRLFIVLFTLSISVTVIPCGLIYIYGLFGEVKSVAAAEDKQAGQEKLSSVSERKYSIKGEVVRNQWLEIVILILGLIYFSYMDRLPPGETIVTLKVRMDD